MGTREDIEQALKDSEEAFEHCKRRVEIGNEAFRDKVKVYAGEVSGLRIALSILDAHSGEEDELSA